MFLVSVFVSVHMFVISFNNYKVHYGNYYFAILGKLCSFAGVCVAA